MLRDDASGPCVLKTERPLAGTGGRSMSHPAMKGGEAYGSATVIRSGCPGFGCLLQIDEVA